MAKALIKLSTALRRGMHQNNLPTSLILLSSSQRYHKLPKSPKSPAASASASTKPSSSTSPARSPSPYSASSAASYYLESLCPQCGKADPSTSTLATAPCSAGKLKPIPLPPCAYMAPACRERCVCRSSTPSATTTNTASSSTGTGKGKGKDKPIRSRVQLHPCARCCGSAGSHAPRVVGRLLSSARRTWLRALSKVVAGERARERMQKRLGLESFRARLREERFEKAEKRRDDAEGLQDLLSCEERRARWEAEEDGEEEVLERKARRGGVAIEGLLV